MPPIEQYDILLPPGVHHPYRERLAEVRDPALVDDAAFRRLGRPEGVLPAGGREDVSRRERAVRRVTEEGRRALPERRAEHQDSRLGRRDADAALDEVRAVRLGQGETGELGRVMEREEDVEEEVGGVGRFRVGYFDVVERGAGGACREGVVGGRERAGRLVWNCGEGANDCALQLDVYCDYV